ncbi:DMT family transporter [Cognatishimia sp. D5M38]|uniref:DMT family transporter n=1 Tax=Cognatishimia coralii TaxID=3083254 RepID=A0ABU8QKV2_9RHOB
MPTLLSANRSDEQAKTMAILTAGLASLLVALTVVVTRGIVDRIDPLLLGFLRYAPAGVFFVPALILRTKDIAARDWWPMIGLGVMFYGLYPWLFSAALNFTTALHAALIITLMPMITLVIGVLTRTEQLQPAKVLGISLAIGGVITAFSESFFKEQNLPDRALTGDLIMLFAVFLSALFNVGSQRFVKRYSALTVTAVCMTSGSVVLLISVASTGLLPAINELTAPDWKILAFLCLGGALLGNLLWVFALGLTAPSRVAVFAMFPPVGVAALGMLLLGEIPSTIALCGLALVLAGIYTTQLGRN